MFFYYICQIYSNIFTNSYGINSQINVLTNELISSNKMSENLFKHYKKNNFLIYFMNTNCIFLLCLIGLIMLAFSLS